MKIITFLKRMLSTITGFSTPFFGLSWDSSKIANKKNNKIYSYNDRANYIGKKRIFQVTEYKPVRVNLPIEIAVFKNILLRVSLINAENISWRVGFRFIKESAPKKVYVFHVFQDDNDSFHSRIVEITDKEIEPDVKKHFIDVKNTKKFTIAVNRKDNELFFYVDKILLGKYIIPFQEITDLEISAWSHRNTIPITVIFEDIRVWSEKIDERKEAKTTKKIPTIFPHIAWNEKWWIKYLIFPIFTTIIASFFIYRLGLNGVIKENITQSQSSVLTQSPKPSASIKSIAPLEIVDYISSLPPLQQTEVALNYKGIKISWSVHLEGGNTSAINKNLYTIFLRDKNLYPLIICNIDLTNYPQLKIIKKDQDFIVEGEIDNVDLSNIDLINCKLSF